MIGPLIYVGQVMNAVHTNYSYTALSNCLYLYTHLLVSYSYIWIAIRLQLSIRSFPMQLAQLIIPY